MLSRRQRLLKAFSEPLRSTHPSEDPDNRPPRKTVCPRVTLFRLAFLDSAQTNSGNSALFLLDEVLELRTFDSFPGLRTVLPELLRTLQGSRNRFVMSTRYVSRAHRLLRNASPEYEVIHVPPLSSAEIADKLSPEYAPQDAHALTELAQAVQVLTDGRPGYVQILDDAMRGMAGRVGDDPVAALTAQMSRGAPLWERCRFYFELRLHRARGYGALKAILLVLADQEPLTLTEIAQRLQRTPGSTKDYLSWLEDVDLISARQSATVLWTRCSACGSRSTAGLSRSTRSN